MALQGGSLHLHTVNIKKAVAHQNGGAIKADSVQQLELLNVIVRGGSAMAGAAVYLRACNGSVQSSVFMNNTVSVPGRQGKLSAFWVGRSALLCAGYCT